MSTQLIRTRHERGQIDYRVIECIEVHVCVDVQLQHGPQSVEVTQAGRISAAVEVIH